MRVPLFRIMFVTFKIISPLRRFIITGCMLYEYISKIRLRNKYHKWMPYSRETLGRR